MSDELPCLTPEQIALLAPFVREYERACENLRVVQARMQAEVAHATEVRDLCGQRMLRAGALALGGRRDLQIDFDTFAVRQEGEAFPE